MKATPNMAITIFNLCTCSQQTLQLLYRQYFQEVEIKVKLTFAQNTDFLTVQEYPVQVTVTDGKITTVLWTAGELW